MLAFGGLFFIWKREEHDVRMIEIGSNMFMRAEYISSHRTSSPFPILQLFNLAVTTEYMTWEGEIASWNEPRDRP